MSAEREPAEDRTKEGRPNGWVIDVDRHVQETWRIFQDFADPAFRERVYRRVTRPDGAPAIALGDRLMPFSAAMWDDPLANRMFDDGRFGPTSPLARALEPASYLEVMDEEGIDAAYVTPTLAMGNFSVEDGQVGSALCRAYGRWAREFCRLAPDRLLAFYPVNLHDVEQAVRDARWAAEELGVRGFQLLALTVGERPLHHADFDPFWAVVQDLEHPVQVHSLSSLPGKDGKGPLVDRIAGVKRFGANLCLHHLVSHRIEQHLAILAIVMGGVLERFPRLRFVFVEAGAGWIPSWLAEMDGHFHQESMRRWVPWLRMPPSEYFRRQCLACFNADETDLGTAVPLVGSGHVAWSSDYPHHDGVYPGAVDAVTSQLGGLGADERGQVLGGNAARFVGLS